MGATMPPWASHATGAWEKSGLGKVGHGYFRPPAHDPPIRCNAKVKMGIHLAMQFLSGIPKIRGDNHQTEERLNPILGVKVYNPGGHKCYI